MTSSWPAGAEDEVETAPGARSDPEKPPASEFLRASAACCPKVGPLAASCCAVAARSKPSCCWLLPCLGLGLGLGQGGLGLTQGPDPPCPNPHPNPSPDPNLLVELLEGLATLLGEVALLAVLGRRLLVPRALVPLLEGVLRVLHLVRVRDGLGSGSGVGLEG